MDQIVVVVQRFAGNVMELAVLFVPLTVYLLLIGLGVNRARHPTVVRGPWSFALLLLGLSGFLLLGPLSWIAHLFRPQGVTAYWGAYAAYLVALLCTCWSLCSRQRRTLVIYNIEPEQLATVLQEVLKDLNIPYAHTPGRVSFEQGKLLMDIETSQLWHNCSLHWSGHAPEIRAPIESAVRQAVRSVESGGNPASLLLSLLAVVIISFQVLAGIVFVLFGA